MAEELLELGRVHKPHGLKGEVAVSFISNRPERWSVGAQLKVGEQWRTISAARSHQGRILIQFEGVGDRGAAEALSGAVIWGIPLLDPTALWVHELIGAEVIDQDGTARGRVKAVLENPASDLLLMESEALIPLNFVVAFDAEHAKIEVDVPPGLFELS